MYLGTMAFDVSGPAISTHSSWNLVDCSFGILNSPCGASGIVLISDLSEPGPELLSGHVVPLHESNYAIKFYKMPARVMEPILRHFVLGPVLEPNQRRGS